MTRDFIARKIFLIIKRTFSYLNVPNQKALSNIISALFENPSFSLYNIASKLPLNTSNKHKHKYLIRHLDQIEINDNFWKSYIKTIFCLPYIRLRRRKFITILLDATTVKDDIWILSGSITYESRAIPIYMETWKGVNERYDYWERVKKFVKKMRRYLPEGYRYIIVGDRGFQGHRIPKMTREMKERMDFIIRINDSYYVQLKNGEEYLQLSLFEEGKIECRKLGKINSIEDVNVIISKIKDEEENKEKKWYLMTNIKDLEWEELRDIYAKRMWIEESFKDLKSILKWEEYGKHKPIFERQKKMIIISGLSYAIQMSMGNIPAIKEKRWKKESVIKGFRNFMSGLERKVKDVISLFTLIVINKIYILDKYFF